MSEDTNETPVIDDPKAVLAALDRAKKEAKQFREERDDLQAKLDAHEDDSAVSEWKDRAKKAEVRATLLQQGVGDVDRVLKYVSLDGVDFDDEGGLTGLAESIAQVKSDLPELFDPKSRVKGAADLFTNGEPKVQKTGTELQVERLFKSAS